MSPTAKPVRVRVTSPRRGARATTPLRVAREIDEQTAVGEVYMRSLVRAQLRAALAVLAVVGLPMLSLPIGLALSPALRHADVAGIPLVWVLLGCAVYPMLWLGGWAYVRASDRIEAEFASIVDEHQR